MWPQKYKPTVCEAQQHVVKSNRTIGEGVQFIGELQRCSDVFCLWGCWDSLGCDGECDVAAHYLYWQHIHHTLSPIAFICMGHVGGGWCDSKLNSVLKPHTYTNICAMPNRKAVLLFTAEGKPFIAYSHHLFMGKCFHIMPMAEQHLVLIVLFG